MRVGNSDERKKLSARYRLCPNGHTLHPQLYSIDDLPRYISLSLSVSLSAFLELHPSVASEWMSSSWLPAWDGKSQGHLSSLHSSATDTRFFGLTDQMEVASGLGPRCQDSRIPNIGYGFGWPHAYACTTVLYNTDDIIV
jgi:hypothetical protein